LQNHILNYSAFTYKALDTNDLKVITKIPLNFVHLTQATFANVYLNKNHGLWGEVHFVVVMLWWQQYSHDASNVFGMFTIFLT
jgi:hypothetical protein